MSLLVYTPVINSRVEYTMKLVLGTLLNIEYKITSDIEQYKAFEGARLNYNNRQVVEGECWIIPAGLLNERGVNSHQIKVIEYADTKAFFPVFGKGASMPFDLFSATFFMVSRYEEYLPHMRDEHGRFSAFSSFAYQNNFLQSPVVNLWAKELARILVELHPALYIPGTRYQFIPTIDIDAAWAFKHKGLFRTIGGFLKDIKALDMESFSKRYKVMIGTGKDPFDTYDLMHSIHKRFNLHPLFFILYAGYEQYDKNTPVNSTAFQLMIKWLDDEGTVGIHPSYASNDDETLLVREIEGLSEILHREITISRQHFLKLTMPDTYRNLLAHDIAHDFTMGFAAQTGFRAGICTSFKWYDIEMERATNLVIHPFMLMDGTLRDYMKIDADEAMRHIRPLIDTVRSVGGTFISLWHNESLSNWRRWEGWVGVYEQMLEYATSVRGREGERE